MVSLQQVATFLLKDLSRVDTCNLALVEKQIFFGPPTSYITTRVYNRVHRKKHLHIPRLWDFVDTLVIEKPNLHILETSLEGLDIKSLELRWTFPFVQITTDPPLLDLKKWSPYLKVLRIREDGIARHSLPLFANLVPFDLKLLDIRNIHSKLSVINLQNIIQLSLKVQMCQCLSDFICLEKKIELFPCLFTTQVPNNAENEN